MNTALHFEVIGRTWEGRKAAYQYTTTANVPFWPRRVARMVRDGLVRGDRRELPPSVPDMGDFACILDVRIIHEANAYESTRGGISRRIDTFTTLAGWRDSRSAKRYAKATNA